MKSEQKHHYHIYWSVWKQLSFKKSLLWICKKLNLFVNTLTADDKYSLLNRENLTQPIQMELSQKQKPFPQFFSRILKSSWNFQHFQQIDDAHSWCISQNTDSVKQVRSMSNKSRLRGRFKKQHGKRDQTLSKSERQHHHHIYWSMWRQMSCKKSLLLTHKIWSLFVNTLNVDDKYSLVNRDNLMQPIQMKLS